MVYADGFDDSKWQTASTGFIAAWQSGAEYVSGVVVTRGSSILRCTIPHLSVDFNNTERNNWEIIAGKGAIIPTWQPYTEYGIDEAVIDHDAIYRSNVNHLSSATFKDDMSVGDEKWRVVGASGGSSLYQQVTKLGTTATVANPKVVEIPINPTTTFCLAPVEVLKFTQGEQNVVSTACEFDNADAKDFVYDANYVDFDGVMKLKTSFDVKMSTPSLLGNYYISESDEINFADYKKVEGVI